MARLKLFIPLIIFVVLAGVFWSVLQRGDYDPQALPSALIGQSVPAFSLPVLESDKTVTDKDLLGQVYLLNVWATWCITCRVEHPHLNELAQQGVRIVGLNYKDERAKALEWLNKLGTPYQFNIFDAEGKLGLDLGVYGAPETYLVDKQGIIQQKFVGMVDETVWREKLKPLYDQLSKP